MSISGMKKLKDQRFIHIVGMYKSGTSWLLHILANHPEIIAWREFDILRAVYDYRARPLSYIRRGLNKILRLTGLSRRLDSEALALKQLVPILKDRETIIRNIFCGRGWIPMLGVDKQSEAMNLDYSDPHSFLENLLSIEKLKLQADNTPKLVADKFDNTLSAANTRRSDLEKFVKDVISIQNLHDVPSVYFNYLIGQVVPQAYIALKAADQLICIKELRQITPESKKIVVVRDGRDVALSALAFTKLMKKWEAPWTPKESDYFEVLKSWALRISLLEKEIEKGDLLVIRYEDLTMNFESTCVRLFRELELSADLNLIQNIKKNTDFKVVSGGRNPGEKAEHLVRSGVIGEWTSELNQKERSKAWKAASYQLSLLGYREDGGFDDWPGFIKMGNL